MTIIETRPLSGTARERVEQQHKIVQDITVELEKLGDNASDDDWGKLTAATEDLQAELVKFDQAGKTAGVLGQGAALLAQLEGSPDDNPTNLDALEAATGVKNPKGMTIGEAFVQSPAYEEFLDAAMGADGEISEGWSGKSKALTLDGVSIAQHGAALRNGDAQNLVTGASSTSGGALIEPTRFPGVVDLDPFPELTMWDVCTKIPVSGDAFKYAEITSKTNNADFVPEATTADDIDGTTVTDVDGGLKPRSDLALAERTGIIETVAHVIPVTRRAAADAPQLMAIINAFMRVGLEVKIEDGLVNGNGTSPELRGLLNTTTPYNLHSITGVADRVDALLQAVATIRASDRTFRPNAVLINSADWFSPTFLAKKDDNQNYQLGDPKAAPGAFPLWGLRVIISDAVPAGTQVVGDWRWAIIADRMRASLFVSDSNRDWFERNILAILAEQRLGFGVMAPQAFAVVSA